MQTSNVHTASQALLNNSRSVNRISSLFPRHHLPHKEPCQHHFSLFKLLTFSWLFSAVNGQTFPSRINITDIPGQYGIDITESSTDAEFGNHIILSDLNGDGLSDLIMSGSEGQNVLHIIWGSLQAKSLNNISLGSLDGTQGFTISSTMFALNPPTIASGDLNGDGINDLIVVFRHGEISNNSEGISFLVFGKRDLGSSGNISLDSLDRSNGCLLAYGGLANLLSGYSLDFAGDLNNDSYGDISIGAYGLKRVFVIYGGQNICAGAPLNLMQLSASRGCTIEDADPDISQLRPVGINDVDGDNIPDLGIEQRGTTWDLNRAALLFGETQFCPSGKIILNGTQELSIRTDLTQHILDGIGPRGRDFDGDGVNDLAIKLMSLNNMYPTKLFVVFGGAHLRSSSPLILENLSNSEAIQIFPNTPVLWSPLTFASSGDLNGDGIADLVILNQLSGPDEVIVIWGAPNIGAHGSIDPTNLSSTEGFIIQEKFDFFGFKGLGLSSGGDFDGDGVDDLALNRDDRWTSSNEVALVFYGRNFSLPTLAPAPPTLKPTTKASITNSSPSSLGPSSAQSVDTQSSMASSPSLSTTDKTTASALIGNRSIRSLPSSSTTSNSADVSSTTRFEDRRSSEGDWKVVAGVAGGVAAFCLSLLGGVIIYFRSKIDRQLRDTEMKSARDPDQENEAENRIPRGVRPVYDAPQAQQQIVMGHYPQLPEIRGGEGNYRDVPLQQAGENTIGNALQQANRHYADEKAAKEIDRLRAAGALSGEVVRSEDLPIIPETPD